jgi:hypothetical protein
MINLDRSAIDNAVAIGNSVYPLNTIHYDTQDRKYRLYYLGNKFAEAPWTEFMAQGVPFESEEDFKSYLQAAIFRPLA